MTKKETQLAQIQKFKQAARELEVDDSEENFDHIVKRVAKSKAEKRPKDRKD